MNSDMFLLLWILSPILVACVVFFTFVMQWNELTVSIAFTAIALFSMIQAPLNVIPAWIVQILQTKIVLDRIAVGPPPQGPLLSNRTVVSLSSFRGWRLAILVTYHVELMLPGTYYLVRMLDGMIDTQGTVKELRSQGILNDIAQDEAVEAPKEEEAVAVDVVADNAADLDGEAEAKPVGEAKKAQQLINDEAREYGAVKWSIYSHTGLECILTVLVVVVQLLGVGEKLWIRQWGNTYGYFGINWSTRS
ncbi:hypothetical protein FIBSPDRAFT_949774 [Athelia psychrophila]|uniref:ABC transmembrane type-1 domain-containing protein n=1 Tax=Athelia psychrophila TaxID=1759441 RepID=A0A166PDE7_9AGAM|nr:hypothetical protein FIBSPDRAFT_949774 [Fibularhizoctonia sp. CBS 109695]